MLERTQDRESETPQLGGSAFSSFLFLAFKHNKYLLSHIVQVGSESWNKLVLAQGIS